MTFYKQWCLSDAKFYENIANFGPLARESFKSLSLRLVNHDKSTGQNILKKILIKDKYWQKLLKKREKISIEKSIHNQLGKAFW